MSTWNPEAPIVLCKTCVANGEHRPAGMRTYDTEYVCHDCRSDES